MEDGEDLRVSTIYGERTIKEADALLLKCKTCKSKKLVCFDELLGAQGEENPDCGRFAEVEKLESMTAEERYTFWRSELSRCIRCNACRNVCPACSCEKCVFDNHDSGFENKAIADSFEENMFHIIRRTTAATARVRPQEVRVRQPRFPPAAENKAIADSRGERRAFRLRCTGCGECSASVRSISRCIF